MQRLISNSADQADGCSYIAEGFDLSCCRAMRLLHTNLKGLILNHVGQKAIGPQWFEGFDIEDVPSHKRIFPIRLKCLILNGLGAETIFPYSLERFELKPVRSN